MIHYFYYLILGHFKSDFTKAILSVLSISLGIALFVSTQINSWKAEKSIVDQTIGFASENFIGRFVYQETFDKDFKYFNFIKTLDSQISDLVRIEPELHLKSYFNLEDNQTLSIPTIGRDLLITNLESGNSDIKNQPKKYFFSKPLIQKLKLQSVAIAVNICDSQLFIQPDEIEAVNQDGLFIIMDISRLQSICKTNSFTTINLTNRSTENIPSFTNSFLDHPNWLYESKEEIKERAGVALGSLKINLTIISLVSVLISFFMVSNIYSGLFISQKKDFGILLSIGGNRISNFFLFLMQTTILATLGGIFGTTIGILFSKFNYFQTLNTLTDANQIDTYLHFPTEILLYGFFISILGSIFSAILNAIKAYKILPIELLKEKEDYVHISPLYFSRKIVLLIAILLIGSGIFLGFLTLEKQIFPGLVGIGFVIVGFVLINFLSIPISISFLSKITRLIQVSPSFILGIREIETDSWKNSLTISTIMLSTSLVFTLTCLTDSYEVSLKRWVDSENKSDYSLINEKKLGSGEAGVPVNLLVDLKNSNYFTEVEPFLINSKFIVNGKYFTLHVLHFKEGQKKDEILVSKNFCFLEKLCKGDSIEILTEKKGNLSIRIQDQIEHFFSERGTIVMDYDYFKTLYSEKYLNSIRVTIQNHNKKQEILSYIRDLSNKNDLTYFDHEQLKELYITGMNQVFKVLDKLKISAITISILSLITSIFYFIKEKSRILAGLKAIGMSSKQMFTLIFYQTLFLFSHGIISGILNSLILSPIVIFGINKNAFGWELDFSFPVHFVAKLPIVIPSFTFIITLIPFYFLLRMKISKELNYE